MKSHQIMKSVTAVVLAGAFAFSLAHPAVALQAYSVVTCALASPTPCVGGTNTSSGPGVQGISSLGFGNVGQTKFASTSTSNGKAGVLGEDVSTSGTNDEGVRGTSTRGLGVHGISSSRSGVRGDSTSAQGVFGSSSTGTGVQGVSATHAGVVGQSTSTSAAGDGGDFSAAGNGSGVTATAVNGGTGLFASSHTGVGVFGQGSEGIEASDRGSGDDFLASGNGGHLFRAINSSAVDVFTLNDNGDINATGPATVGPVVGSAGIIGTSDEIGVRGTLQGTPTGAIQAGVVGDNGSGNSTAAIYANGFGGMLFVGNNFNGQNVFTVDDAGNVFIQGNVNASSYSTHTAVRTMQRTRNGGEVETYAPEGAAPTMEDFGEARLIGGTGYVPLKSSFGSAIDHNQPYLVFITPQGVTRGPLNVVQKDLRGFTVRESGGSSSVAFDYRIVAKPYVTHRALPAQPAIMPKHRLFLPAP
ncbi:MAG: hypothetical protein JO165_08120, partial [Candidatus Eremiobacteraeota bacterium]|nr:hypothetical protein [Candidatus Eremiobacteraeota bacterium]